VLVVGLTGGIASGKSTVARFLFEAGARIVDADRIARAVVAPGTPAHAEIVAAFGPTILLPDGRIDRKRLGGIIFSDPVQQAALNAIVHPRVFEHFGMVIDRIAAESPDAVVVMDVPLLFETGMHRDLAEVIVVYVPEALQLQRLMARDGISAADATARIRSQLPIAEKGRCATIVIDNIGSKTATRQLVSALFERLKTGAATGVR
jgi:dephospho-CoA kinase